MTNLLFSDTPIHIRKKQIEIVLSKSNEERLRQCAEMSEFSYNQSINLLRKRMNNCNEHDIKMAYIETCYKSEINEEYLTFIKSNNIK
jgi:hypothetical protein